MGDQEMMYHPPEQSGQEPPPVPINKDPREQPGAHQAPAEPHSTSYDEGYQGPYGSSSYMQGEKITPRRTVTLETWQLILLLFVAFIVGAGLGGSLFSGFVGFVLGVVGLAV